MTLGEGVADLHVHTTASDGTADLAARIERARKCGLETLAVTDHDSITDDLSGRVTDAGGLEVVTGVEVRADLMDTKIELLGYYVDPTDRQLTEVLERVRRYRHDRNRALVDRLQEVTDLDHTYERLRERADGTLGRPHLAAALVEEGIVDSVGEAFDEYLGSDGRAFVPMDRVPYSEVLAAIHAAGGVASLAHPGRIRSDEVPEMVERLTEAGLDGIEVWYPYGDISDDAYANVGVDAARRLADCHGLIPTGGSDCHGPESGKDRLGEVRVPAGTVDRLRDRAGVTAPSPGGDEP